MGNKCCDCHERDQKYENTYVSDRFALKTPKQEGKPINYSSKHSLGDNNTVNYALIVKSGLESTNYNSMQTNSPNTDNNNQSENIRNNNYHDILAPSIRESSENHEN